MLFHVIDKDGNVDNSEDWVLGQYGELRYLCEGWGCEGGGGSCAAPEGHRAVFGPAPSQEAKPAPVVKTPTKPKSYDFKCSCGASFAEHRSAQSHCADTKQPGPHIISFV